MSEPPFLRFTWCAVEVPRPGGAGSHAANSSLDEERREVLDSVLNAMARNRRDPDEMAACRHLLRRLAESAGRY